MSVASSEAIELRGFHRPGGRFGVRNHLLVLPSVVCATQAAREIASGEGAVGIVHQHGCLHVGDDLRHTEDELLGTATNPDVGAVLVVSLGCETLRGRRLAAAIGERGQTVELVGIQAAGGSERAVAEGRQAVARMSAALAGQARQPVELGELAVGIDQHDRDPFVAALAAELRARGLRVLTAPEGLQGAEAHVTLAGLGVHLLVNLPGPDEAPIGFAAAPVVAVGRDFDLHRALADDFDVQLGEESSQAAAELVFERLLTHAGGEATAAERRGARDFVLQRLAVTM
ncbi:MAG: UxaA family hydrolase [Solirubrobacterales bacterium]